VGLERGPLSLTSATEELLGRKSSGSSLENRYYSHRGQTLALTSPTSGGRSVGIVRLWTQAMEFFFVTVHCIRKIVVLTALKLLFIFISRICAHSSGYKEFYFLGNNTV
jgi:hypothetical protein